MLETAMAATQGQKKMFGLTRVRALIATNC
jgi:hypothetical protein